MSLVDRIVVQAWVDYWRFWQLYHRYSVHGIENLDGDRAVLIAGYHGRPLAFDMCMLTAAIHDRYGYLPHGIVHRGVERFPVMNRIVRGLGFVTDDGPEIRAAVAAGEHITVTPGGGQEGCRTYLENYRVAWHGRLGYVRLAAKYALPIVPVAAAGADETYIGLNDAEALGRLYGLSREVSFACWLGLGPVGFYPFSPPWPVRLRQIIGPAIDFWGGVPEPNPSVERQLEVHDVVVRIVQNQLDRARSQPWDVDDGGTS